MTSAGAMCHSAMSDDKDSAGGDSGSGVEIGGFALQQIAHMTFWHSCSGIQEALESSTHLTSSLLF